MTSQPTAAPSLDVSVRMLAGNEPLSLNDASLAWVVESGEAEVFCLELGEDGVAGPRHYLFSVTAGDLLMGVTPPASGRLIGLLAVGLVGTSVRQTSITELRARAAGPEAANGILASVDAWVLGMSSGRRDEKYHHPTKTLTARAAVALANGETAGPLDGVVWLSEFTGNARYLGSPIALAPAAAVPVPLGEPAWIVADGDCQVRVADGPPTPDGEVLWQALQDFNQMVLAREQQRLDQLATRDASRVQREAVLELRHREGALRSLAAVLNAGQATLLQEVGNPLFAACTIVAGAMGMRVRQPPQAEGAPESPDPLAGIAKASRIRMRRVSLSGEWWRQEAGPMLGFVVEDPPRPVALLPARGRSYVMVDPKTGRTAAVDAAVRAKLAPQAYAFYRPFPERAINGMDMLRFALRGTKPDLLRILVLGVIVALIATFTPVATGVIFGSVIPSGEHHRLAEIAVALVGAAVASSLFEVARSLGVLRLEARLDTSLQSAVWDRVLTLPAPFFRGYASGDLANRAMGINQMRQILEGATITTVLSAVFSIPSLILMFYYSATLALVGVALMLIAMAALVLAGAVQLRYVRRLSALQGQIAGTLLQFITGIAKLRVAAAEARAFWVWAQAFAEQKRLFYRAQNAGNFLTTFYTVVPLLASLVIFAVIAAEPQGSVSTAAYLAFTAAFTGQVLVAVLSLGQAATAVLQCVPLYERALPILRTLPEVTDAKADPGVLSGAIEISHVQFRYQPDGPLVLQDLTIPVAAGEMVAIVGPSGAGKSSIFRLLLGFEAPEAGSVYYDGRDLQGLDSSSVRRQIGVVLQDARVIPGSIFENIVGSLPLTLDDAWEAARMAGLEEDVRRMPMQMQTYISEGGATFSGGQRQRLMIARALVARPRILLFDEATSALDNMTQAIVTESMANLKATRIVIAHRLSTVQGADRIVVVEAGRVAQTGSYDKLITEPGPFADLAQRQLV